MAIKDLTDAQAAPTSPDDEGLEPAVCIRVTLMQIILLEALADRVWGGAE
jgi:hypothetical protein